MKNVLKQVGKWAGIVIAFCLCVVVLGEFITSSEHQKTVREEYPGINLKVMTREEVETLYKQIKEKEVQKIRDENLKIIEKKGLEK